MSKVPLFQNVKGINHYRGDALCKIIMFILIFNLIFKNTWIDQQNKIISLKTNRKLSPRIKLYSSFSDT